MAETWKLFAHGTKRAIEDALLVHEQAQDWDPEVVLSASEAAPERPDDWVLEAWLERRPRKAETDAFLSLFSSPPQDHGAERVEDVDWVVVSQQSAKPIRAGRFHVHTPDFPPSDEAGVTNFEIPASQAFGTGQHETTAGCLEMLSTMKARGVVARNIADIGTGTGLLAFAALDLWPGAYATASDIDPVCEQVVVENAELNRIIQGIGRGELAYVTAPGLEDSVLQGAAPFDLLIANILAGPLIELSRSFAGAIVPRGNLVLAGLLATQEPAVLRAYRLRGFSPRARIVNGDWSILWLRKRPTA